MHPTPSEPPAPILPWLPLGTKPTRSVAAALPCHRPATGNQSWAGSSRCKVYWRGRGGARGAMAKPPRVFGEVAVALSGGSAQGRPFAGLPSAGASSAQR